jgi:hypothetical protein
MAPASIFIDVNGACRMPAGTDPHGLSQTLSMSSGSTSTALELLKETWISSGSNGKAMGTSSELGGSSADTDIHTPGQSLSFTGRSLSDHRVASTSHGLSGNIDTAGTFHSVLTQSWASTAIAEGTEQDTDKDDGVKETRHHEDLWTCGVNPADVEIMRDRCGQAVVLGRGAYATVYLGRWQATYVAAKIMLAGESDAAEAEVKTEADILRRLRHPNIVLLMAVCVAPGQKVLQTCPHNTQTSQ